MSLKVSASGTFLGCFLAGTSFFLKVCILDPSSLGNLSFHFVSFCFVCVMAQVHSK